MLLVIYQIVDELVFFFLLESYLLFLTNISGKIDCPHDQKFILIRKSQEHGLINYGI